MKLYIFNKQHLAWWALLVILATSAWLYAPGIHGPTLLDDRSSVLVLNSMSNSGSSPVELIFADRSGPLGRPVSIATFVVERLFFQADIAFSKAVNIGLHLFNGILVAWLATVLLRTARYPNVAWLAVLAAGLWLLAPLFVSTVLYMVQRMAILATTFMLLTMLAYIYWRRLYLAGRIAWPLILLAVSFFVVGMFAKETVIVVLPTLVILELFWFSGRDDHGVRSLPLWHGALALLVAGALLVASVFVFFPEYPLGTYAARDFSPLERLLTQSRILWDYTGQFFWPNVQRMGLYHDDIAISRTLTEPATTTYAVVGWLVVLGFVAGVARFDAGRRIGFAILFFLLGHSTESTILPLDLYYEHRNYFPAIGLALLVVVCIGEASRFARELSAPLLCWLGVCLLALAFKTSSQVQVWSSAPLLGLNHVIAHPNSFRANSDMAVMMAEVGAFESALDYSQQAHQSADETAGDHYVRNLALSCMAGQQIPEGVGPGSESLAGGRPIRSVTGFHLLVKWLQSESCSHLDRVNIADILAAAYLYAEDESAAVADVYSLLGVLENSLGRYENAYFYTEKFLNLSPNNPRGLLMQLHFTTALGKVQEALELRNRLLALHAAGGLSISEQETLALYLEAD